MSFLSIDGGASRSAPVCEPLPTGGQNHQSRSLAALDRRLSASAGGASLTLSLEYGTTSSSPDSRTSFSGTRRRIVPNRPDFTSANPSPSSLNTVSISPILYPLESKSSRPSKLSMLRVLNRVLPKMVSALASALWQCVKPCPISVARDAYRLSHRTHGVRSQTSETATSPARQFQPYQGSPAWARRNFHVGQS